MAIQFGDVLESIRQRSEMAKNRWSNTSRALGGLAGTIGGIGTKLETRSLAEKERALAKRLAAMGHAYRLSETGEEQRQIGAREAAARGATATQAGLEREHEANMERLRAEAQKEVAQIHAKGTGDNEDALAYARRVVELYDLVAEQIGLTSRMAGVSGGTELPLTDQELLSMAQQFKDFMVAMRLDPQMQVDLTRVYETFTGTRGLVSRGGPPGDLGAATTGGQQIQGISQPTVAPTSQPEGTEAMTGAGIPSTWQNVPMGQLAKQAGQQVVKAVESLRGPETFTAVGGLPTGRPERPRVDMLEGAQQTIRKALGADQKITQEEVGAVRAALKDVPQDNGTLSALTRATEDALTTGDLTKATKTVLQLMQTLDAAARRAGQ